MADDKLNVLVVEDDPQLLRILEAVLKEDVTIRSAGTGRLALQELERELPAIVLLDMRLPDMLGMEILKDLRRRGATSTVIVMTAHGSVDLAVEAMREGAYDFLTKPLDFERVRVMVRNAIERHRIISELNSFRSQYERARFRGLVGSSPAMQRLYRQLRSAGAGSGPVLLAGEPGTELDACAQALHDEGPRASKALGSANARGLAADVLAKAILDAGGSTLHLRGVEHLGAEAATALLQFLREGTVGDETVDARVIASTTENLAKLAETDAFNGDLLVVLESTQITVPPLRERGDDILDLADYVLAGASKEFERSFAEFSDEAQVALVEYGWPGNREELEKAVNHAVSQNEGRVVGIEMLPGDIAAAFRRDGAADAPVPRGLAVSGTVRPLWQVEREAIEKALKLCEGNVLHAARLLEVTPGTIYRKQQSWKARKG